MANKFKVQVYFIPINRLEDETSAIESKIQTLLNAMDDSNRDLVDIKIQNVTGGLLFLFYFKQRI